MMIYNVFDLQKGQSLFFILIYSAKMYTIEYHLAVWIGVSDMERLYKIFQGKPKSSYKSSPIVWYFVINIKKV